MKLLLVFIGGGLGSMLRFLVSLAFASADKAVWFYFPIGTLSVNIMASLVVGFIMGLELLNVVSAETKLLIGTGFCGGLSTFSTFAFESLSLIQEKYYFLFILNLVLNNVLTIGFAFAGYFLARLLFAKG